MYQYETLERETYEYDPFYDTRTNSSYGSSYYGLIGGILISLVGSFLVALTLVDLEWGVYNGNKIISQNNVLLWTENPIWPTYGKGIWVGSLMIATGLLGIWSHCEETNTAIKAFGVMSLITSIFLFYLMISTIKEIQYGEQAKRTANYNSLANYNTFAMNSALAGVGSFGLLLTVIFGAIALSSSDCFSDTRDDYLKSSY